MPQIIELPDGVELEVPDGLDDAQLSEVVETFQAQAGGGAAPGTPVTGTAPPALAAGPTGKPVPGAPSEDGSFLDSIGQGLTLGLADELGGGIAGVGQVAANALGFGDGQTFGEAFTERRDEKRGEAAGFAERNPATDIGLQLAGGLAVPGIGAAGTAARGGLTAARAAGLGAASGGIAGFGASEEQGNELVQDTLTGAALGGVAGGALQGAGNILSKVARQTAGGPGVVPGESVLKRGAHAVARKVGVDIPETPPAVPSGKFQSHIKALDDAGVPITGGQRSGNTTQIAAETTAAPTAFGGGITDIFDEQGTVVRSRLMAKAGFDADDLEAGVIDPKTIDRAKERFGIRYTDALEGAEVDLSTPIFTEKLSKVRDTNLELLPFERKGTLGRIVDDFTEAVTKDPLTGKEYQRIRSRLGKLETSTRANDGITADLYGDLKSALDDTFAEAAGKETATAKKLIDRDYRNFKVLEEAALGPGAGPAGGEPTLASIGNRARKKKNGGTDDFSALASAAQDIVTDRTPNSGTTSRALSFVKGSQGTAARAALSGARAFGVGTGTTAGQRSAGATLSTGAVPSVYQALLGFSDPDPDQEIQQQILLDSFNQAGAQLQ